MSAIEFLSRSCPVCDSPANRPRLQKNSLALVQCLRCGMIFANPVPKEFETGDFYDHSGQYYLSEAKLQSDYASVRFDRELRLFRQFVPHGRILDVGCSTGAFLHQLKLRHPSDYQILGTDVAGPALDYAESKNIPVLRGDFLQQTFLEPFDAVTFWAVAEHLVHPRPFLQKAAQILRPGAHCFLLVPNFQSLATRILGARYRYILPQHVNYFTAKTLRALCEQNFQIELLTSSHFNPLVILQDFRAPQKEVSEQERAALLKRTTELKQKSGASILRWGYRQTEHLLANMMLADNLVAILRSR